MQARWNRDEHGFGWEYGRIVGAPGSSKTDIKGYVRCQHGGLVLVTVAELLALDGLVVVSEKQNRADTPDYLKIDGWLPEVAKIATLGELERIVNLVDAGYAHRRGMGGR